MSKQTEISTSRSESLSLLLCQRQPESGAD